MQGVHMHTSAGKLKGLVSTAPLMQNLNTFQENRGKPADMRDVRQSKCGIGLSWEGEVYIKNTITDTHWERALLNLKYSIRWTDMTSPSGQMSF